MELLAVVAILGFLAAIALPRLADSSVWSVRGEKEAAKVAAALKLARRLAVENGATNAAGYAVECTETSYRIKNLQTGACQPDVSLSGAWRFKESSYCVGFDAYGGGRETNGHGACLELNGPGGGRWNVRFEPATGYVWCEGP